MYTFFHICDYTFFRILNKIIIKIKSYLVDRKSLNENNNLSEDPVDYIFQKLIKYDSPQCYT